MVDIRQARLNDYPAIAEFITEVYGALAVYKGEARWRWQFIDNPFKSCPDDLVPVWIALDGARVVGQIATQLGQLKVADEILVAGWIVDVVVLPSYRNLGIAQRLYEAVAKQVAILVTLTMAPATRRMGHRLGAVTLPAMHQFSRWARLDSDVVRRYVQMRTSSKTGWRRASKVANEIGFAKVFTTLVNPILRVRDTFRRTSPSQGLEILEVERFGADVDELWDRAEGSYPVAVPRQQRFLNWRFCECPQLSYHRFIARRYNRTVGYVVLRRTEPVELPQGIIVDLFAERNDTETLRNLLEFGVAWFGNDVASVEIATSISEIKRLVRKVGFISTQTLRPTVLCANSKLRQRIDATTTGWLLSKADHDWDQIHLA